MAGWKEKWQREMGKGCEQKEERWLFRSGGRASISLSHSRLLCSISAGAHNTCCEAQIAPQIFSEADTSHRGHCVGVKPLICQLYFFFTSTERGNKWWHPTYTCKSCSVKDKWWPISDKALVYSVCWGKNSSKGRFYRKNWIKTDLLRKCEVQKSSRSS